MSLAKSVARLETKLADLEVTSEIKNLDMNMLQESLHEKDLLIDRIKCEISTDIEKSKNLEEKYFALEKQKEKLDEDNAELMAAIDAKERYYQQLQIEFQALVANKENENAQLFQTLSEKETEINNLKATLNSFSTETSKNVKYSEDVKCELVEKCNHISLLENDLATKSHDLNLAQMQLEASHQNISEIDKALNVSRDELEHHKKQREELSQKLDQLMQENRDKESVLKSLEMAKVEYEQQVFALQNDIQIKDASIANFESDIERCDLQSLEIENLKSYIEQLLEQMNNNSTKYHETNESYKATIREEETKSTQLREEIFTCKAELAQNQEENLNLVASVEDLSSKLKYFEELSHTQYSNLQGNDTQMEHLSNEVTKLEGQKLAYEEEISNLEQAIDSEKVSYGNLLSQYESVSKQLVLKDAEISTLHATLSSKSADIHSSSADIIEPESDTSYPSREASQAFEEENNRLREQLKGAKQAIVHLETSLATQSFIQETPQEGSEMWGVVDLGEPSVTEPSLFMQTSLMEKDKTVTVIQEQLKSALEDVNVANDEKKILQHQMKTLEAELTRKDEKVSGLETRIEELQGTIANLNQRLHQFDATDSSILTDETIATQILCQPSHAPSQEEGTSPVISYFRSESQLPDTPEHELPTPGEWLKPSTEDGSKSFWGNIEEHEDELEPNDQLRAYPPKEAEAPTATEVSTEQTQSLDDIKYRLSWYEENWAMWTEHYNQLQSNYQLAEQQITLLNQELETLKNAAGASEQETLTREKTLVDNLEELNETLSKMKEDKNQLEETIQNLRDEQSTTVNILNEKHHSQLEEVNQEVTKLKGFETQVYELQGQLQTLQHQCSVLEAKVGDAEVNASKVAEYEMLYGELQTCMQEAETKREGSKSRVQELELMVQSAESEIARLRSDLQGLTDAGDALEGERNALREASENQKEELRKSVTERERFEKENDRLQREAASMHSQILELQDLNQRSQSEIDQLRSEVEVLEGENERTRSNLEILESEMNRLRHENEVLTQNNQIAVAEKESLETETQRLTNSNSSLTVEKDHIQGEVQRLSEMTTSAESEITRLRIEMQNLGTLDSRYQELEKKYTELQDRITEAETLGIREPTQEEAHELQLEEVDWGTEAKIEDEHLQRSSSSVEREELHQMKVRVIALEKEKNEINEELQVAKLKNGKMVQKVKAANNKNGNLLKEIQKLKKKAGGFSDLDMALEEEWKSRVTRVEGERDELKIKLDEMEKEKHYLKDRLDMLETAQDKYFELKESQDVNLRQLSSRNKNLESQISSLEWKVSELEENLEQQQHLHEQVSEKKSDSVADPQPVDRVAIQEMQQTIVSLKQEIDELKDENYEVKALNEKLKPKLDELNEENETLRSALDDSRDAKSKAETNANSYKTSFLELHTENETLQETYDKVNKELESIKYEQMTLKAAYDALYEEYHQLQENRDSVRLELGIMTGERDKLQEEVSSLNNQLQALQEEEEEEIIKALQDECADLRIQNNELKDEITRMTESIRQMEESVERMNHSLDQQVDIQDLLRSEIISKSAQSDSQAMTITQQEQQIKYTNAEIAALKTKCSQQQQALEELEPQFENTKKILAQVQERNKQLTKQVEVADASLVKLATRQTQEETEQRFSTLEASELEAALSSLHLRDLRCQQLSLEINNLLEERDGLQLKLSAALSQNQDLTRELSLSQQLPSPQSPLTSLSQKLAELRDLNSSLEKKAMDSLRGGGNVASTFGTLPPSFPTFVSHTAPSTPTATRHRDYTVTRENQGAPSVLMNWFLGKSTPKEVLHV